MPGPRCNTLINFKTNKRLESCLMNKILLSSTCIILAQNLHLGWYLLTALFVIILLLLDMKKNSQLTCTTGKYKLIYPVSVSVRIWLADSCRQIYSSCLEDLVNSGIGLTLSPQSQTMNFATDLKESAREYWLMYRGAGFFPCRIIWPLVLFKQFIMLSACHLKLTLPLTQSQSSEVVSAHRNLTEAIL